MMMISAFALSALFLVSYVAITFWSAMYPIATTT